MQVSLLILKDLHIRTAAKKPLLSVLMAGEVRVSGLVEKELTDCGFEIALEKQRIQYIPSQESIDELENKVLEII